MDKGGKGEKERERCGEPSSACSSVLSKFTDRPKTSAPCIKCLKAFLIVKGHGDRISMSSIKACSEALESWLRHPET